jgi:hypothetical protein
VFPDPKYFIMIRKKDRGRQSLSLCQGFLKVEERVEKKTFIG